MSEKSDSAIFEELYHQIITFLDEKKADNIVTIDLKDKSYIADRLIVASGASTRQVGALAENLYRTLKQMGLKPSIEGLPQCDWVIVDAGDIIIHIFRPEVRAFYNLEKMWGAEMPISPSSLS